MLNQSIKILVNATFPTDQYLDNALNNANAQTLRTRAGFQSGQWYGLSGLLEVDNVSRIGDDAYNSTRNGFQSGQWYGLSGLLVS